VSVAARRSTRTFGVNEQGLAVVTKKRMILVGVFLLEDRENPIHRMLYDDWKAAYEDAQAWMAKGFVKLGLPNSAQDYYAPGQIYKVRLRPVTKVVTESRLTGIPFPETQEVAHFEDEDGNAFDVWTDTI